MEPQDTLEGWLLSREQRQQGDGLELIYWLATADGPRCVVVPNQPYTAFIRQDQEVQWQEWLGNRGGFTLKAIPARDFRLQPQCALYVYDAKLWQRLRQQARDSGWSLLEADIRPADRYLMERQIHAGMAVKVAGNRVVAARGASPGHGLRLVSLDIECSRHGELFSIGLYSDTEQRVLMVGPAQPAPDYVQFLDDEVGLLRALMHWFERWDPDGIIGWSVIRFDLDLLQKRADRHGLRLALGRDGSAPRWHEKAGAGRDCAIAGRVVFDGIDWLKAAFYQFDSFALENVAREMLGEGKACDDPQDRLAEIERNFVHDKAALAHYNLKDCELVWRIFEHTQLAEFILARGQIAGIELDRTGGSVASFYHRYLPQLHRAGFVAPDLDSPDIEASPGGYVMDSLPGLYRNVLVLDFKSLYPSIIRSFLIDPMGMVTGMAETDPALTVEGFRGARFHRTQHRLPAIVAELAAQREQAKARQDQPLSQAIKILMNSFYGVLGAGGCRFHDPRLASSITLRGHEIMQRTRDVIQAQGYRVIYGDTDSTFVHLGDHRPADECDAIGRQLVAGVNAFWRDELAAQGLDSALELEFEQRFDHFFMPTIRGSQTGSKKRYVGGYRQGDALQLVFKGMETVRSDWTPLARQFQQQLYHAWFAGEPVVPLVKHWLSRLRGGELDDLLVYSKRLRQPLEAYHANAPHVMAARRANELLEQAHYRRGSRIRYFMGAQGAYPLEDRGGRPDREHYVTKQLRPVAEPVLQQQGLDFDALDGDQIALF